MTIDKEIKKKITSDWLSAFPQLSSFAQNKLYKIIGCSIAGIELIKLPSSEAYSPHFTAYPLWNINPKIILDRPSLLIQIYNRKGLQFSIPYSRHNSYFNEAVEAITKQITISLYGDVKLNSWFEMIDSCFNDILVSSNAAQQAKLLELKYYSAVYVGFEEQVRSVLIEIEERQNNWNMQMFEMWFGKYEIWLQGLHEVFTNRNDFLERIAANKLLPKISDLSKSELKK